MSKNAVLFPLWQLQVGKRWVPQIKAEKGDFPLIAHIEKGVYSVSSLMGSSSPHWV